MQCQYLIKLLNKKQNKMITKEIKKNPHTKTIKIICADAQHLAVQTQYINIKNIIKLNILIIPELIILLMNTVRNSPSLVNVIVFVGF
jgi:hypothetical protein